VASGQPGDDTGQRHRPSGQPRQTAPTTGTEKEQVLEQGARALPDWLNGENFKAWIAIRPARARTAQAQKSAIEKLERFRAHGFDPNEIVGESLANGWQGIFAPKGGNGQPAAQTIAERNRAASDEAVRRFQEEERELASFAAEAGLIRLDGEDDARWRERIRAERHSRGRAHVEALRAKFA
jgi:hypothetical protein